MPQLDKDVVARRVEALCLMRLSSATEGLRSAARHAAMLDPFARGRTERAAFLRRVSVEFRPGRADK